MKGLFVMIDGLDGGGKGTIVDAYKEYYELQAKKVFDVREYAKEHGDIPEIDVAKDYDVIVSAEPTYGRIGKEIREEIVRNGERKYSALTTAHAFALDREILYKKLIIPALKLGKDVFQERGVVTSIIYQPVQLEQISLRDIINMPGNRLAIQHAPDVLLITKVKPEVVMERLKERKKQDNAIFEQIFFQRKIAERYESEWLRKIFEIKDTKVIYLDTNPPSTIDDTKKKAISILQKVKSKELAGEGPFVF